LCPFIPSEYYKIDEWDDDEASPTAGQAEIMMHRNGSIENVRLKFIGLGKFDNLEDHSYDDLPSSMNQDDPFQTKSYPRHMKHLGVILMMMTTTVTCLF
jgi:replicative DNA helicase